MERLGATSPFTKLVLQLDGVHPDEAFSVIPYEKGSLFLRYLEDLFGGPGKFLCENSRRILFLQFNINVGFPKKI